MKGKYLFIYTNVFLIRGYTQSIVLDLSKNDWIYLDNEFADIFELFSKQPIEAIEQTFDLNGREEFQVFITFLLENDYGTFVDDLSLFPPIQEVWDSPYKISNCIIDFNGKVHNLVKISNELYLLGCQYIELRFYYSAPIEELEGVLDSLSNRDFRNIHIITKSHPNISKSDLAALHKKFLNCSFTIYSHPENIFYESELENVLPAVGYINYIKQNITGCIDCGIINPTTIINPKNVSLLMRNRLYNSCLDRKIAIDINGSIKNCPSMRDHFGNIETESLILVANDTSFQKKWRINKDQIKVCQDCEFRYLCSDCRAYTDDPMDELAKPLKCGYDPYSGQWSEWSLNPLKQMAINYYGIKGDTLSNT